MNQDNFDAALHRTLVSSFGELVAMGVEWSDLFTHTQNDKIHPVTRIEFCNLIYRKFFSQGSSFGHGQIIEACRTTAIKCFRLYLEQQGLAVKLVPEPGCGAPTPM